MTVTVAEPVLSRVETVMRAIEARIEGRALGPGARLPSVRGLADSMQVSKSTVVEAYDRLAARGAIVSRPGRASSSPPARSRSASPRSGRGSTGRSIRSGSPGNHSRRGRIP
jgi:DNA-binding transcriptional MocR family regulator